MTILLDAGGRVFGLDQDTLIEIGIYLFNAIFFVVVFTWILYKPVKKFMKKRADGINAQMDAAADTAAQAEEMKTLYEQKLHELESERLKVLESAHELAAEKSRQLMEETEKETAGMKERAAAEMLAERERAAEEIRVHIIDVASAMAEKFMARAIDGEARGRLFDETLAELEKVL
ncbi:MAG: ATP synthase F0 subunit B [Oscillospiraceae bacterium]|nr:ATP synthase F0 subunit B [Oscillospiraceae bacterium]